MPTGMSIHIGLNRVNPKHYRDEFGRPWDGLLAACEFDAKDMQALAQARGFRTSLLLTERAKARTVISAISRAARQLKSGDTLLVTYSGHGGQIPDEFDEEPDRLDETWVLFDRELIDDELYALWGQFQPGVRIIVFSDSCHSGSANARDDQTPRRHDRAGSRARKALSGPAGGGARGNLSGPSPALPEQTAGQSAGRPASGAGKRVADLRLPG